MKHHIYKNLKNIFIFRFSYYFSFIYDVVFLIQKIYLMDQGKDIDFSIFSLKLHFDRISNRLYGGNNSSRRLNHNVSYNDCFIVIFAFFIYIKNE